MKASITAAAVAITLLAGADRAFAQIDFTGTWVLDRDISTDLAHATFEPRQSEEERDQGYSGGIGGWRVFGSGGQGGSRRSGQAEGERRGAAAQALTPDERTRLREIADYVKTLGSIAIEHTDHSTFTVTDAHGRSHLFPTDGTQAPQTFATTTVDTTTKWDGPHIVTLFRIGATRDLLFTYILVPATRQMALRISLDESGRPRADVPELRLVYKLKPAQAPSPKPD